VAARFIERGSKRGGVSKDFQRKAESSHIKKPTKANKEKNDGGARLNVSKNKIGLNTTEKHQL